MLGHWTETPVERGAKTAAPIKTRRISRLIDFREFLYRYEWGFIFLLSIERRVVREAGPRAIGTINDWLDYKAFWPSEGRARPEGFTSATADLSLNPVRSSGC